MKHGLLVLFGIIFLGGITVIRSNYQMQISERYCRKGHLNADRSECTRDQSEALKRVFNLGSDYHLATGEIEKTNCLIIEEMKKGPVKTGFGSVKGEFIEKDCSEFFDFPLKHCFVARENSKIAIVGVDADCLNGIFFNGEKMTIVEGKVIPIQVPTQQ